MSLPLGPDDIKFDKYLIKCYAGSADCNTKANTKSLATLLDLQKANLRNVLQEVDQRAMLAGKKIRVVVTTVYNPFPIDGTTCIDTNAGAGLGVTPAEFGMRTRCTRIGTSSAHPWWMAEGNPVHDAISWISDSRRVRGGRCLSSSR